MALTAQLYDKQDDLYFSIVNFPVLCSNIPISLAYGLDMKELVQQTISF
jgi:hypothetical protein